MGSGGAAGSTGAVAAEAAVPEPPAFEAVTSTRITAPTSAAVRASSTATAPAIGVQVPPSSSERSHW